MVGECRRYFVFFFVFFVCVVDAASGGGGIIVVNVVGVRMSGDGFGRHSCGWVSFALVPILVMMIAVAAVVGCHCWLRQVLWWFRLLRSFRLRLRLRNSILRMPQHHPSFNGGTEQMECLFPSLQSGQLLCRFLDQSTHVQIGIETGGIE